MAKIPDNVAMDVDSDTIRRRLSFFSKASFKNTSVTPNISLILYHERIEINNDFPDEEVENPVYSSQLSYKDNNGAGNSVRKVTGISSTRN